MIWDAWWVAWMLVSIGAVAVLDPIAYVVPGGRTLSSYVKRQLHRLPTWARIVLFVLWCVGWAVLGAHFMGWIF